MTTPAPTERIDPAAVLPAELLATADWADECNLAGFGHVMRRAAAALVRQQDRAGELEGQRDKLQRFKDWVHAYLDARGVPHHPPGTHGAEGCRIGDRMDWLMDKVSGLERLAAGLAERVEQQQAILSRVAERGKALTAAEIDGLYAVTGGEG